MNFDLGERPIDDYEKSNSWDFPEKDANGSGWPAIIPLDSYSSLPEFPTELLPSPGKEMVEKVAEVNQVDAGMAGGIFLSILSITAVQRKMSI